MKPYLLSLFFRVLSKFSGDAKKGHALSAMADEMAALTRLKRVSRRAKPLK